MQLRHGLDKIHHTLAALLRREMGECGAVLEDTAGFEGHDLNRVQSDQEERLRDGPVPTKKVWPMTEWSSQLEKQGC
jgi:hypothetical protein